MPDNRGMDAFPVDAVHSSLFRGTESENFKRTTLFWNSDDDYNREIRAEHVSL
jgi:hypothetical protein